MIKTKIFSQSDQKKLENEVNQFIHRISRKNLIDIKFSASTTKGSLTGELYTVLIIYEE
ncbi:sporulation protein Cse60 [Paenibacillus sp. NPDC058177]|uniref:sporulation protein Cse60 n=1 Tax=Paenibacillus sp. NPDC058177 TaxID=3346369 RepID=UPI0036DF1DA8